MQIIRSSLVLGLLGGLTAACAQTATDRVTGAQVATNETLTATDKVTGAKVATNETLGCRGRFQWQQRHQLILCYKRGNLLWQKGELDRAIKDYTAALRISPIVMGP